MPPTRGATGARLFRREGDVWMIGAPERPLRLRDAKGLRYLAHLLGRPGVEVHALELVAAEGGAALREADAGARLDAAARRAYTARLESLADELREAEAHRDTGRRERLRAERDWIARELGAAVGLGGRDRPAVRSAAERARVSVAKGVKSALRRIEAADPALGYEMRAGIRTGIYCSYQPDPGARLDWRLS